MKLLLVKIANFDRTVLTFLLEPSGHLRQVFETDTEERAERFAKANLKPGESFEWCSANDERYLEAKHAGKFLYQ